MWREILTTKTKTKMKWEYVKKYKHYHILLIITTFCFLALYASAVNLYSIIDNIPPSPFSCDTGQFQASDEVSDAYCDSKCQVEQEIREIAKREGANADYLVELAECESSLNPLAVSDGMYNSRGIFQISSYYHPTVSDETAFSVELSTLWAIQQIEYGNQEIWTCNSIISK